MLTNQKQIYLIFCIFFWLFSADFSTAKSGTARIVLATGNVPPGSPFTITVTIEGSDQREYDRFPDIAGMSRRSIITTTATTQQGAAASPKVVQQITQQYLPERSGLFRIPPFSMVINGQPVSSPGGLVTVSSAPAETETDFAEATDDLLPESRTSVFFSVRSSRSRVYVGQGFTLSIGLFVAEDYPAVLNFYQLNTQLARLVRQLRPANCWEENMGIQGQPQQIPVRIGGREFLEYRLFEAVYYPLTRQDIRFPATALTMQLDARSDGNTGLQTYPSAGFSVSVGPLPARTSPGTGAVGRFRVQENVSNPSVATGQSFTYEISISGEGNPAPIDLPTPTPDAFVEVYPPEIEQNIIRRRGRVEARKTFRYQLIARRAGPLELGRYFRWSHFDPEQRRYIGWRSGLKVEASGATVTNATATGASGDQLFRDLEQRSTTEPYIDFRRLLVSAANILLTVMFLGLIFISIRGKRG